MSKYRLKKDWISAIGEKSSTGELFIRDGKVYRGEQSKQCFIIDAVEHNPDWFEEIKEPERIEVKEFYFECSSFCTKEYVLSTTQSIPPEKYPSIKSAIEKVLNDDSKYKNMKDAQDILSNAARNVFDEKKYTQKDLWDTWFNAIWSMGTKKTFKDYLQSLNK
jgi:hypothetical protein